MTKFIGMACGVFLLVATSIQGQSGGGLSGSPGEMTGTIKEYTPGTSLVLETLAPSVPVQFKLAKTVVYSDTDGKNIEAAGLTTNRKVVVHYTKIGGDYVADKVSLVP